MKKLFAVVVLLIVSVSSLAMAEDADTTAITKPCKTVEVCTPLAEKGDVEAQLRLVLFHSMKRGAFLMSEDKLIKKNLKIEAAEAKKNAERHGAEVLKWLMTAERRDDVRALRHLGRLYARGEIVVKDEKKAADYYIKAAKAGDWLSQHQLGEFYYAGRGIEKDTLTAYAWLNCALKSSSAQKGEGTAFKRERMEHLLSSITKELNAAQIKDAEKLATQYILDYVEPFQSIQPTGTK